MLWRCMGCGSLGMRGGISCDLWGWGLREAGEEGRGEEKNVVDGVGYLMRWEGDRSRVGKQG